jgi:hypothetical protein
MAKKSKVSILKQIAIVMLVSMPVLADISYLENFDSTPNGNLPTGWDSSVYSGSSGTFEVQGGELEGSAVYAAAFYDANNSSNWSNYTARVKVTSNQWNRNTSAWQGLAICIQKPYGYGFTNEAYYGLRFRKSETSINTPTIWQVYKAQTDGSYGIVAETDHYEFFPNDWFTLQLSAVTVDEGVLLSAKIWDRTQDPDVDEPIYRIDDVIDSYTNPIGGVDPYETGTAGVLAYNFSGWTAVFDDFQVNTFVGECGDRLHPQPTGDITGDCIVNFADVAAMAESWLECTSPLPPCNYNPF